MKAAVVEALRALRPGATECPGRLARRLHLTMAKLRAALVRLELEGVVGIFQRGRQVALGDVRGPFRVGLVADVCCAGDCCAGDVYQKFIGVDYSGAGLPDQPLAGLEIFVAGRTGGPERVAGPHSRGLWSRRALALWLAEVLNSGGPVLVGIDHAFGVPEGWLRSQGLRSWPGLLRMAWHRWRTQQRSVGALRKEFPFPPAQEGWRICDRLAPGAKSVFHFDVPGAVAASTLAGLPWLYWLRNQAGRRIHCWPFDGWRPPPGRSVLAEVFPSFWRKDTDAPVELGPHARDAWIIAQRLQMAAAHGQLAAWFAPGLPTSARSRARKEGWILGLIPEESRLAKDAQRRA